METIEYRNIEKTDWGDGPWQDEPDKVQFPDPETGLPCLAKRHPSSGHWCGYVGVTEGHPLFGEDAFDDAREEFYDFDVHGGVTYTAFCADGDEADSVCHIPGPGEPDHVWWIGFDFHHAYDVAPGLDARLRETAPELVDDPRWPTVYWTLDAVKAECAKAAAQLAAMR